MTKQDDFKAVCTRLTHYVAAHPDATDDELRYNVEHDHDVEPAQLTRAIQAVRRFKTQPVTTTVPTAFVEVWDRVCRAYDRKVDAAQRGAYYELLSDLPVDVLTEAGTELARTRPTWPRVADWREAAALVRRARAPRYVPPSAVPIAGTGDVEATYCCHRCQDTGWAPECGCAMGTLVAGHCTVHPRVEHGITYRPRYDPCACRANNPAFQANHQPVYGGRPAR